MSEGRPVLPGAAFWPDTLLGSLGTDATGQASGESALECAPVGRTTMGREHVLDRQREQRA
jgi:hypothetical protein